MYDYAWLYMTIYNYLWLYMTFYDYVWIFMNMYDYVQICMTMYGYVSLNTTMFDCIWLCITTYDHAPCTMYDYVDYIWQCMTMYHYVWICLKHLNLFEFVQLTQLYTNSMLVSWTCLGWFRIVQNSSKWIKWFKKAENESI